MLAKMIGALIFSALVICTLWIGKYGLTLVTTVVVGIRLINEIDKIMKEG